MQNEVGRSWEKWEETKIMDYIFPDEYLLSTTISACEWLDTDLGIASS